MFLIIFKVLYEGCCHGYSYAITHARVHNEEWVTLNANTYDLEKINSHNYYTPAKQSLRGYTVFTLSIFLSIHPSVFPNITEAFLF